MQTSARELPLVSVAIPLYKSRRFLDIVIENIEAIDYPNVEIIVSDRHCADDAIDRLAERFKGDARLKFLKADDGINWPEHYNFLLQAAAGRYFVWMPHDDSFLPGYLTQLVACLEERPEVVLAYGRMETIDLDGRPLPKRPRHELPVEPGEPWTMGVAARLLMFGYLGVQFRGVFRRDVALRAGLLIRPTEGTVACDIYWLFGLALIGRFHFVPACRCRKRYYPTSTHVLQWGPRPTMRHIVDGLRVSSSYIRDYAAGRREACYGYALIFLWTLLRLSLIAAQGIRVPQAARRSVYRLVEGLLFSRG
jgi:glycosyltransferase involved in cell wall biosynthesis